MLQPGDAAPAFSLPDQDNKTHSLADYTGKTILLYFYPKDDTPGCTKEACTIAEVYDEFTGLDVKVIGVSADSSESHKAFAEKYHLPFTLLSDPSHETIKAYGAYKNGEGTEHGAHIERISYLIAPDGVISRSYPNVDPAIHALQILKDLRG